MYGNVYIVLGVLNVAVVGTIVMSNFHDSSLVVNKHSGQPFDVYVGRPSKWGNPFVIGRGGNRNKCIAKYRAYVLGNKELMASLHELTGKRLACWCAPLACHADVLVELANSIHVQSQE